MMPRLIVAPSWGLSAAPTADGAGGQIGVVFRFLDQPGP
jgi:hypothetical protein